MPITALLLKLAADHESAGDTALAFGSEEHAARHFAVMEASHVLISALAAVDEASAPAPSRVVRRVPIRAVADDPNWVLHT